MNVKEIKCKKRMSAYIIRFILLTLILFIFIGCATKKLTRQEKDSRLEDPQKSLWITVRSEPPGAKIYGAPGNSLGSYLGKTPLTLKYTRISGGIWGHSPDETLETRWINDTPLRTGEAFMAFKCYVVAEGEPPYRIYEVLQNDTWWFFGRKHLEFAGKQKTFTAFLPTQQYHRDTDIPNRLQYQSSSHEKCQRAKQEYKAALIAYKKALRDIDASENTAAIGSYGLRTNTPGTAKGIAGLLYAGSVLGNQDARRELRETEIRLEQARAKMAICN